jgi:hypothetical protein
MGYGRTQSLRVDKKAVSPAISTVILTAAIMVMILVAMSYANSFLNTRIAENEFNTNKKFMLTTGLQIDDTAWTIGRTQTIHYSSKYGNMKFQSSAITYNFEVFDGSEWKTLDVETGMILYNMPINLYSIGNNYFERITPSYSGSFLQEGSTAPASYVFCVAKMPMNDGDYTRIAVVPTIRILTSTIAGPEGTSTTYTKVYLSTLVPPDLHPQRSQSITLTGKEISKTVQNGINELRISLTFPNTDLGFDSEFFSFKQLSETISLNNSVVEIYVGKVQVTLGQI